MHDAQGVARGAGTFAQEVFKVHLIVGDVFFEVVVFDEWKEFGELDQFEVVGGYSSNAFLFDQGTNIGFATDEAFVVVGAFEDFVDQEENGITGTGFQAFEQAFEASDFGVEVGVAVGQ